MNKKQRLILKKIFEEPERSDISWKDIEGLFVVLAVLQKCLKKGRLKMLFEEWG